LPAVPAIYPDRKPVRPQSYASDGLDAIGFVQFWGNSFAMDLVEDVDDSIQEPVNILLIGTSDIRHIMRTAAAHYCREGQRPIHFWMHESVPEVLARDVLFLHLLNQRHLHPRQRTEMFLSIFGNTLIRELDESYIDSVVDELLAVVTESQEHGMHELVDFSELKYRERDSVHDSIVAWRRSVPFDAEALRDQRCRGFYRSRFDYRVNLMDWNYQWNVKLVASIINWRHYKEFGLTGVAYEFRLDPYNKPNRTLANYVEGKSQTKGTTILVRGYWGDVINSPYWCFGTDCNEKDKLRLFKTSQTLHRHTETDLSEFNVSGYISEMETGIPHRLPAEKPEEDIFPYSSPLEEMAPKVEEVTEPVEKKEEEKPRSRRKKTFPEFEPMPALKKVKVKLLSGEILDYMRKAKNKGKFHKIVFGSMASWPLVSESGAQDEPKITPEEAPKIIRAPTEDADGLGRLAAESAVRHAIRPDGLLMVESFKCQTQLEGKTKLAFRHRICRSAHTLGFSLRDDADKVAPPLEKDVTNPKAMEVERYAPEYLIFRPVPITGLESEEISQAKEAEATPVPGG